MVFLSVLYSVALYEVGVDKTDKRGMQLFELRYLITKSCALKNLQAWNCLSSFSEVNLSCFESFCVFPNHSGLVLGKKNNRISRMNDRGFSFNNVQEIIRM